MDTPDIAADILAGVLALGFPLVAPFERRLYAVNRGTALKLTAYGMNIGLLWGLAAAAGWIEGWSRLFTSPAVGVAWLWAPAISGPGLGVGLTAFMVVALMPLIQSLRGPRRRLEYAAAVRRAFADIPAMLPDTAGERMGWVLLSLSAGVCEEVLFRGFLIRFLHDAGVSLPVGAALAASSLIFGLCHLYQGGKGVVSATVGGLSFGLLYLLTGNLAICIALHALIDLQMAYVLRPGGVAAPGE